MSRSLAAIQTEHDRSHLAAFMGYFDYYCVAHGEDYGPKYLNGEMCHDGMGDGECHPDCRICPQDCPVKPCPIEEEA